MLNIFVARCVFVCYSCKPVFRCLHYASCAAFSFQLTSLSFWYHSTVAPLFCLLLSITRWLYIDYRVSFADPVAVRHALEILSELATRDPYAVAMALGYFILLTRSLYLSQHLLHLNFHGGIGMEVCLL